MSESKNTEKRQEEAEANAVGNMMTDARKAMEFWQVENRRILHGEEISIFIAGYFTGTKKTSEVYEEMIDAH